MFDLQIQNGYRQNTNKSDLYACHKQHLLMEI